MTTPAPGVEPDYDTYAESETDTTRHKPDPVDVRVIAAAPTPDARPRSIVTEQVPVSGLVVRVAGENRLRTRLVLRADGDVWIGGPGVTPGTGFNIAGTQPIVLTSTGAVYAIAGADQVCSVLAEFLDG